MAGWPLRRFPEIPLEICEPAKIEVSGNFPGNLRPARRSVKGNSVSLSELSVAQDRTNIILPSLTCDTGRRYNQRALHYFFSFCSSCVAANAANAATAHAQRERRTPSVRMSVFKMPRARMENNQVALDALRMYEVSVWRFATLPRPSAPLVD